MILAALVAGWMTIYANGSAVGPAVHGVGSSRDCGSHEFMRDDGERVRVVISCETKRK